jgi:cobalamin biosynthesis protein CobD/CbiB
MFKTPIIHRFDRKNPVSNSWSAIRRQVNESPLVALGVAAGAGVLAWSLLKPRAKKHQGVARRMVGAIGNQVRPARRSFKAAVGSLALAYLNRKLRSRLHW